VAIDGVEIDEVTAYRFHNIRGDHTIAATFTSATDRLTVPAAIVTSQGHAR
jgi:hypothetical protein